MERLLSALGFPSQTEKQAMRMEHQAMLEAVGAVSRSTSAVAVAALVAEIEAPPPLAAPKEPVPIPDPTITPAAQMDDALRAQYAALAAELGVTQPGLLKDAAHAFFRDRGTRLYDHTKVHAYLDDQYGKETTHQQASGAHCSCCRDGLHIYVFQAATWGWRPLRVADRQTAPPPEPQTNGVVMMGSWGNYRGSTKNNDIWDAWHIATYAKPLPLPVLITAKEVVTAFPSAKCFISDDLSRESYQAGLRPTLDPFLLVVIEDERFIIERWDEPAYRE